MQLSEFIPPFCPKRTCPAHRSPGIRFWTRAGHYQPQCRSFRIPRFRCKVCRKGFSFQTFRIDYRDLRPEVNTSLMRHLVSGMSMRQAGRMVGLNIHGVQHKARKLARHLRLLNRNLTTSIPENCVLSLDELETFEHSSIQPVTVPVAIDDASKFVIAVDVAPIRRMAKKGSKRQQRIDKHESKSGKREDRGRQSVHKVFGRLQTLLAGKAATLVTDQKTCYATEVRRRFAAHVIHFTVNSKAPRTTQNPLFSINLTEAMMRDNNGRLRRRSWLVTKVRWALRLQLEMFMAYRNWIRPRTNHDAPNMTPGVVMGLCPRNLTFEETLAWRQHWRRRSPHPMSETGLLSIESLAS